MIQNQEANSLQKNEKVLPCETDLRMIDRHMQNDLSTHLSNFKDLKKGLRILAKKIGIHEKTLSRILQGTNKPSPQTCLKFYRFHFNVYNDQELLKHLPKEIQTYLIKFIVHEKNNNLEYAPSADQLLLKHPVCHHLFLLAATGAFAKELVIKKFGDYGLSQLQKLLEQRILIEVGHELYSIGEHRPVFDGELILKSGILLSEAYGSITKSELTDQNFIGFFAEGLNEEAYQKWLEIDERAYREKMEIVKDGKNLGKEKVFTFMISERISDIETNNGVENRNKH